MGRLEDWFILPVVRAWGRLGDWWAGPMAPCGRRGCRELHCPSCEVGHVQGGGANCSACPWNDRGSTGDPAVA